MSYLKLCFILFAIQSLPVQTIDYSYPPLIAGSSWGNIFQRYYLQGDYETMMKLTSQESINQYGYATIKQYYQSMDFGYKLKLKSWTKEKKYYTLNYTSTILATPVVIHVRLLEGDTAKLLLHDNFKTQKYFLYK